MKKYLFIVPSLASGGAERAVSNFASELARQGEAVTVLIYFRMKDEYDIAKNVKLRVLSEGDMGAYNKMGYLQKIKKIRNIIINESPDYIIPFLFQVTVHTMLAGYGYHEKIINTIRNNPAQSPENVVMRFIRDRIICHSTKVIVQNEQQRQYFPSRIQKKIFVLRNAVDESLFSLPRENDDEFYRIVALGRLVPQKNYSLFVEAFFRVSQIYPDIRGEIYGEGPDKETLERLIIDYNLSDVLELKERTNDVKRVYTHADVYVLTSNYEGMPNTLIEAMAAAIPPISTNCPTGPSDLIVNMKNGILVNCNKVDELVEAISYMYTHRSEAKVMGENARKSVKEKCSAEKIAKELISICEK